MLISDFFIIRDEFFRHIRRKLKGVQYDNKIATLKANASSYFSDFTRSHLLTEAGKKELVQAAIICLKKSQVDISNRIKFFEEQIDLTARSGERPMKKQKYIDEMNGHINRLKFDYTPKFPSSDQHTFSWTSFDTDMSFKGFKRKTENDSSVSITKIGDVVFVRLVEEKDPSKKFVSKDKVVYEQL